MTCVEAGGLLAKGGALIPLPSQHRAFLALWRQSVCDYKCPDCAFSFLWFQEKSGEWLGLWNHSLFIFFYLKKRAFFFFFFPVWWFIVHQKTGNCFSQSSHTLLPSLLLPNLLGGKAEMVPALAFLGICTLVPSLWGATPRVSCLVGGSCVHYAGWVHEPCGILPSNGPAVWPPGFLSSMFSQGLPGQAVGVAHHASQEWPQGRTGRCDPAPQPGYLPLVMAIALQHVAWPAQVTKQAVLGWILNSKSEAYDGFSTQFKNDQNSAPGYRSLHQSESCRLVGSWKLPITIFHHSRARGKVRTSWHAEALDHSRAWPFIIQCLARKVKHESICLLMPERTEFPY